MNEYIRDSICYFMKTFSVKREWGTVDIQHHSYSASQPAGLAAGQKSIFGVSICAAAMPHRFFSPKFQGVKSHVMRIAPPLRTKIQATRYSYRCMLSKLGLVIFPELRTNMALQTQIKSFHILKTSQ